MCHQRPCKSCQHNLKGSVLSTTEFSENDEYLLALLCQFISLSAESEEYLLVEQPPLKYT